MEFLKSNLDRKYNIFIFIMFSLVVKPHLLCAEVLMVSTASKNKTILSDIKCFRSIVQEVSARSGSLSHSTLNMLADD